MSAIIKTPPPLNLVQSQLSESNLERIISLGGNGVNRSEKMPAWKTELTQVQISSVVPYTQMLKNRQ